MGQNIWSVNNEVKTMKTRAERFTYLDVKHKKYFSKEITESLGGYDYIFMEFLIDTSISIFCQIERFLIYPPLYSLHPDNGESADNFKIRIYMKTYVSSVKHCRDLCCKNIEDYRIRGVFSKEELCFCELYDRNHYEVDIEMCDYIRSIETKKMKEFNINEQFLQELASLCKSTYIRNFGL